MNDRPDATQISPDLRIISHIDDGYLIVENVEWQDLAGSPGGVGVSVDELDRLIVELGRLREEAKNISLARQMKAPQTSAWYRNDGEMVT